MNPAQFDSLLRVKDSQIKEREQIINSLKLRIDSLETCYSNNLKSAHAHVEHGNYPSPADTFRNNSGDHTHSGGDFAGSQNSTTQEKAELILKNSEIEELKRQIQEKSQDYQKQISSLSRQLASEEHNNRHVKKSYSSDRESLNASILHWQNTVNQVNEEKMQMAKEKEAVKLKNQKLLVRLETVNKYMELLPTRDEHLSLERRKTDLEITNSALNDNLADEKLANARAQAGLKEKDDQISKLINVIENLKIENVNQTHEIKKLQEEVSDNAMKLDNEERIEFNRLKNENRILKLNLEKSINLSNEVTNRLNKEKEEKEVMHTDLRCELAKERAVSETLRNALIDMQGDREKLDSSISGLNEKLESKDQEIGHLKLDLQDSADTLKALDTIKSVESVLNTVSNQISTIVNVIDRQILQAKEDENNAQDIMDISRLLSCSVNNRGEIFGKDSNEELLGLAKSRDILDGPREKAYEIAQKQLKVAINLQSEIDTLRLKLSDRWTDHLASNCQIQ